MKVVKAKYYDKTDEIIQLDPQPVRGVDGKWDYERSGSDEKGNFVVIDFISEKPVYFGYNADGINEKNELTIITEEEWNKTPTLDIENMDITGQEPVESVDVLTLQKSSTTNTKTSQATFTMVIERLLQTTAQLFSNAWAAIKSSFHN
jgi:hypothetical protein